MLAITLNGKPVVLDADTSFTFKRENDMFNDPDTLSGDYIEALSIPLKGNSTILQNINRLTSNIRNKEFDIEIFYNGLKIIEGTYSIKGKNMTQTHVNGDVKINANHFFNLIADKKLIDIEDRDYEIEDFHNIVSLISENDLPDYPFRFPQLKNEDLYDDPININVFPGFISDEDKEKLAFKGMINPYDKTRKEFLFNIIGDVEEVDWKTNIYPYVPCFFFKYIVQKIFNANHYRLAGRIMEDDVFKRLITITNTPLDQINKYKTDLHGISEKILVNGSMYNQVIHFKPAFTAVSDTDKQFNDGVITIKKEGYYIIDSSFSLISEFPIKESEPMSFSITFFVHGRKENIIPGDSYFFYEGDTITDIEIICNAQPTIDKLFHIYGSITFTNRYYENANTYNRKVNIKNHIPTNIEQIKIFSIIKGLYNASFNVDTQRRAVEIVTFDEILNSSATELVIKFPKEMQMKRDTESFSLKYDDSIDHSEAPIINYTSVSTLEMPKTALTGEHCLISNENAVYIFKYDSEKKTYGWEFLSAYNSEEYIEHDDAQTNSFSISCKIFDNSSFKSITGEIQRELMPNISGKAKSVYNKDTDISEMYLAIYHGKAQVNANNPGHQSEIGYLASPAKYDAYGEPISDYGITLDEIRERHYKNYIRFLRDKKLVKMTLPMKLKDFARMTLHRKYKTGNIEYIFKSITSTISMNGYTMPEVEIYLL